MTPALLWASLGLVVVLVGGMLALQWIWLAWRLDRLELLSFRRRRRRSERG